MNGPSSARHGPRLLVVAAIAVATYASSLRLGFLGLDDIVYYKENPALRSGAMSGLASLWTGTILSDYSPVAQLTLWLDLALFGDNLTGVRIHSLFWFVAGAWAVYALVWRVAGRECLALAVAALYAAHPVCALGTVWLAERKHLVSLALVLWSVERYVAARQSQRIPAYAVSVLLAALAVLAKPHAVAAPLMLTAFELVLGDGPVSKRVLRLAPFFLIAAAFTLYSLSSRSDLERQFLGGSRLAAAISIGPILLRYIQHTFWPADLTLYYAFDDRDAVWVWGWCATSGLMLATVAALFLVQRMRRSETGPHPISEGRLMLFGWCFGLAGLSPALNLVPQLAPLADHYHQWALPGWLLSLGVLADSLAMRWRMPAAMRLAAYAAVAGLGAVCVVRTGEFSGARRFFEAAVVKEPGTSLNWSNYAQALYNGAAGEDRLHCGDASLVALMKPDSRRILAQQRAICVVEAVRALKRSRQDERAQTLLAREVAVLRGVAPAYAPVTEAQSELALGSPARAIAALNDMVSGEMLAASQTIRMRTRSGAEFADSFAPLAAIETSGPDAFSNRAGGDTAIKSLCVLAQAHLAGGDNEAAFDIAALAVNTRPDYRPGRVILSEVYKALGMPAAAERMLATVR